MTLLRRLGNKEDLSSEIQKHFPEHILYVEPFFGAGGMFFNKPKAQYNTVNDLDSDVFNLFQVIINRRDELEKLFYQMPIHSDLLEYWKKNTETDPLKKALRFLFLSNFSLYGKIGPLREGLRNEKNQFFLQIDKTFEMLYNVRFFNKDFREFFKVFRSEELQKAFIYADPPYLSTDNNYSSSFSEKDSLDLFECLQNSKSKWAMSEFDHPFILTQAENRGLYIVKLRERRNLMSKERHPEILIMNYKKTVKFF